ncbi:cellulose binding domain-containing protein [Actinacidiphila acididurans]|uniref:Cellulose binding domain-containing protein n=1 Tax=Actinacidiphila acididurans TaxID=2784346 RepID=A0ABS2TMB5_9ACTN|nr:cellulose binding domain-containing protein [Actinacidiphila acididurans]MBM9503390.1 cellulose binding domain-containing protein [Actinacidiphila acididurans]
MRLTRIRSSSRRRLAATAAVGALAAALLAGGGAARADDPPPPSAVDVTVNANEGLGTIPATAYGLNSAIWDSQMNVPEVQNLLGAAGIGALRYPGGSYGDIYHWQTNTAPGGYVAPGTDFDAFMGTVKKIGAQPVLIANYGSGTPQEAADWVRYANITKGYGAKYWEVGNELYGNGHYGSGWETDQHADTSPTAYAHNVLDFVSSMKAVDPTVKVGAVLTMPGNWPDGVMAGGESADWNHTVIPIIAGKADFVIVHWYPSSSGASQMLGSVSQLTGELSQLRDELDAAGAKDTPIALTEVNGGVDEDTQPNALFGADAYFTALQSGVFTVDWWDTHNGPGQISTAPDGATDYQDWGVLSSGTCVGSVCEPPMNTPFPTYWAIRMLSTVGVPGDLLVGAGTSNATVSAHAVRRANGDLSVLLVNKDPSAAQTVALHYTGFTPDPSAAVSVSTFRDRAAGIDTGTSADNATATLPPYSLTTLTLHAKAGTTATLSAPGAPKVTAADDTSATVSWTPATGGTATRYEVYRQFGTTSELLATSTGGSATVHNLTPGTTYTWNVLARDASGRLSRPSDPVTVRTGTPAHSTCQVSYQVTAGWGSGFNANVNITNTGPTPITGWTLAFSFPSPGESVSGFWNAQVAENGQNVVATPVDWNSTLAANGGNSVSFGFTGANDGASPPPTVFTLNGTVCTTA